MEVHGQLLESRADAAVLLEPPDALLDDVPLTIRLLVERRGRIVPRVFVVLVRDDRGMTGSICRPRINCSWRI